MNVVLTREGQADFDALPLAVQPRVRSVLARLNAWPKSRGQSPSGENGQGTTLSELAIGESSSGFLLPM